eukprot:jgi/Psemu1/27674/gm1.27674_g
MDNSNDNQIANIETLNGDESTGHVRISSEKEMRVSNAAPSTAHRHSQHLGATKKLSSPINPKATPKTTNATTPTAIRTSATTLFLLSLLTREIQRDGGACLVTTLKEYIVADHGLKEPLQITPSSHKSSSSSVAIPSTCQKIETVSIFGKPSGCILCRSDSDSSLGAIGVSDHQNQGWYYNNDEYSLSRNENGAAEQTGTTAYNVTNESDDSGVNCHWLLQYCSWELHYFLRYSGFYTDHTLCGYKRPSDVKQVGSRKWEEVTIETFEKIICMETKNVTKVEKGDDDGELKTGSWIHVQDSKAFLRQFDVQPQSDDAYTGSMDGTFTEETKYEDTSCNGCDHHGTALIRRIDQQLTDIVCQKDGGHQVTLQLLLHRYPRFKELLGGRDLWKLYCDYSNLPKYASDNSTNNEHSETFGIDNSKTNTNDNCISSDNCRDNNESKDEKRMKVDEEGLYSMTNNKWGRAMSNILIQICRQTNLYDETRSATQSDDKSSKDHIEGEPNEGVKVHATSKPPKIVIDLTASVGGLTLALARSNFFDRVIALEIDDVRATLCRENLDRHGFLGEEQRDDGSAGNTGRSIVEVRHQDSMQQIPFLPRQACFVIDPPWGGWDYKVKVHRQQLLKLGDVPLQDVLVKISYHNAPCVVGLRLPTNFAVQEFLTVFAKKEEPRIDFECLAIRKMSVQLFVVLYFPSTKTQGLRIGKSSKAATATATQEGSIAAKVFTVAKPYKKKKVYLLLLVPQESNEDSLVVEDLAACVILGLYCKFWAATLQGFSRGRNNCPN